MNIAEFLIAAVRDAHILRGQGKCPRCEEKVKPVDFRDDLSRREFRISGLCQACQDVVFAEREEE